MSENTYCMVMTTTDAEEKAADLAKAIVAAKLAACVQITSIRSIFVWEGKTDDTPEFLLLAKTRDARYEELEKFIKAHHDYDTPEILKVPVLGGFAGYLGWVDENTSD